MNFGIRVFIIGNGQKANEIEHGVSNTQNDNSEILRFLPALSQFQLTPNDNYSKMNSSLTLKDRRAVGIRFLLYILILFVNLPISGFGQEKLNRLVEEREKLHRSWQASEEQKSGIFGNRTKKDMIATNEWMERIIKKDNQIMAELEMLKNIETAEISHDKEDYKYIAQKQQHDINALKRSLVGKDEEIAAIKASKRGYEWAVFWLGLVVIALTIMHYRKAKRNRGEGAIFSADFSRHKQA